MGANAVFIFAANREQLRSILTSKQCMWDPIFQAPVFKGIEPIMGHSWNATLVVSYIPTNSIEGMVHMYLTAPRFRSIDDDGIFCKEVIAELVGCTPNYISMRADDDYRTMPSASVKSLGACIMADYWRTIGKPFTVHAPYHEDSISDDHVATANALWALVRGVLKKQDPFADDFTISTRALTFPGLRELSPSVLQQMLRAPFDETEDVTKLLGTLKVSEPDRCRNIKLDSSDSDSD